MWNPPAKSGLNNNTFEECKKETLKSMQKCFCELSWVFNRNSTQDSTFTHTHDNWLNHTASTTAAAAAAVVSTFTSFGWCLTAISTATTQMSDYCENNKDTNAMYQKNVGKVGFGSILGGIFFSPLSRSFASTFAGAAFHFKWQNDELAQNFQTWIYIYTHTPLYGLFYNSCGRRIQWMHIHDGITSK